jgi:hypothetical protein
MGFFDLFKKKFDIVSPTKAKKIQVNLLAV